MQSFNYSFLNSQITKTKKQGNKDVFLLGSEVWKVWTVLLTQSCLNLCNPTDCSPPGSPVHGIFQARILGWVVISFSRGSSQPRDRTWVSCLQVDSLGLSYQKSMEVSLSSPTLLDCELYYKGRVYVSSILLLPALRPELAAEWVLYKGLLNKCMSDYNNNNNRK